MRRELRSARQGAILILICSGHVALYLVVPPPIAVTPLEPSQDALQLQLLLVPPPLPQAPTVRVPRAGRPQVAAGPSTSIPVPEKPAAGASDWAGSAARAVRAVAEDAPRREFGMPQPGSAPLAPRREFGWSHARTHVIEPLENGGFVYNVSDRCAIVVLFVPLPFCRMGKVPPRGDLFDHLHDAPAAGDWRDPR